MIILFIISYLLISRLSVPFILGLIEGDKKYTSPVEKGNRDFDLGMSIMFFEIIIPFVAVYYTGVWLNRLGRAIRHKIDNRPKKVKLDEA